MKKEVEKIFWSNESKIYHISDINGIHKLENTLRHTIPCTVAVVYKEDPRSLNQNALYYANLDLLAKELGCSKDDMHTDLKYWITEAHRKTGKFLPMIRKTKNRNEKEISSASLDKKEFNLLIDGIIALMWILKVVPIDPDGMYYLIDNN